MAAGTSETATLAGGCFWCLEAVYNRMKGVQSAISGYIGGKNANPSYESVCTGLTGHAEAVQVTFDPKLVSYRDLLHVLFSIHDPTTLNRQGNDVGTQYRSGIYYHSPEQEKTAKEVVAQLTKDKVFAQPIVTEVMPAGTFYPAEAYHQDYFTKNPYQGYCVGVVGPKIAKFRKLFADKVKATS
jgi:peptide-methionine (S)-S-oxide reductase